MMMDEKRTDGQPAGLQEFFAALDMLAALGRERRLRREAQEAAEQQPAVEVRDGG